MDINDMDIQTVDLVPRFKPIRPLILRPLAQLLMKWFLVAFGTFIIMSSALAVKLELNEDPEGNESKLVLTDSAMVFCGLFGVMLISYFTINFHARRNWRKITRDALPHFHESLGSERHCSMKYIGGYGNHPAVFIRMNDKEAPSF